MIWDRIEVGICDAKLAKKLQLDAKLTLDKAVTHVRQQQPLLRGRREGLSHTPVGAAQRDFDNEMLSLQRS